MSKVIFIKQNSPEIRKKLRKAGFSICICASFEDSVWLDYSPDSKMFYDIHGEGYCDPGSLEEKYSPLERITLRLAEDGYYSKDREFFDTVEEFLKVYGKKKIAFKFLS